MASDWMKIELELPDKPEIHTIATLLKADPNTVLGACIRCWAWFTVCCVLVKAIRN